MLVSFILLAEVIFLTVSNDYTLYEKQAEILKALGHPVRLCIINGLLATQGCTVSHIQGCLNIPQSTISQHIAKLKANGIIEGKRQGIEIVYTVVDPLAIKIVQNIYQ